MSIEISTEMRGQAYLICRDYLHGAWKMISSEDMIIKHISGGLSNHLYYCALPATASSVASEPSEVLVRFYGQVHGDGALESILAESVIFTLLSERGLGPRLYGVFPGGRLEQYIPARSLNTAELSDPPISREISKRMARMHALNVPISKEPTWMWNCMKRWLKSSNEFLLTSSSVDSSSPRSSMIQKLREFDYEEELSYLRRLVAHVQSPVVFAHNDMQEGNILINDNMPRICDRISLIDFEYCSYNYRGFDLANHFCEWVYSYKLEEEPYFSFDRKAYPSRQQQLHFIRSYLVAYEAACGRKVAQPAAENGVVGKPSTKRTVPPSGKEEKEGCGEALAEPHPAEEKLLQEVRVFNLASHLFWGLWSIVQAHVSKIPFGYLEFALARLDHYKDTKSSIKSEDITKRKSDQISCKD